MSNPTKAQKAALRCEVEAALAKLPAENRAANSAAARAILERQEVWQHAGSVLLFASMPGEIDVWPLVARALEEGKRVALPRYNRATRNYIACQVRDLSLDVVPGYFGIREPRLECAEEPLNRLDLVLVPGVAFDLHGCRLGRGKGYYDRLLAYVQGVTCGIGFDEQLVTEVPVEAHDAVLNCILTPTRWIDCRRAVLE